MFPSGQLEHGFQINMLQCGHRHTVAATYKGLLCDVQVAGRMTDIISDLEEALALITAQQIFYTRQALIPVGQSLIRLLKQMSILLFLVT
jgi:hypothetical protein